MEITTTNLSKRNATRKGVSTRSYDVKQKRHIATEVSSGRITVPLAEVKYNIPRTTIYDWVKQYGYDIATANPPEQMSEEQKDKLSKLQAENEAVKKVLEESRLKVLALETMIDIAEKELSIDIRKKPGTKQSNG